jgi:cardiolipin synthase A/B
MLFNEESLVQAVETMFLDDFARSTPARAVDFDNRPWWFRLAARTSRLMAPIQ